LDELWSFVLKRKNKRWVWLALCRSTRQVVAYAIGNRGEATCRLLWQRIPESYRRGVLYSDFWESYQRVLPKDRHRPVGKSEGQTNHVERWNCTLRQRLGRYVRKTLFVFEERADARDLPAAVLARLQLGLLKQHKMSHYRREEQAACG
jgi:insertion element IS1 protein InsB